MINPHLPGLKAIEQDGKSLPTNFGRLSSATARTNTKSGVSIEPVAPGLVYDLENNGHYVILASIKNEHGDGQARLVVFDALSGERLAELADAQVLAIDDLDGEGKQEVLLRRGGELLITRWESRDLKKIWSQADVLPILHPLPSEGDLGLTSGNSAVTKGNVTVWHEGARSPQFLLRFHDGVHSCRLAEDRLEVGKLLTEHEALGNVPAAKNPQERVVWDGAKLVTIVNGQEAFRYEPPAPTTYLAPPPLVADLAGKRRILVRDASQQLSSGFTRRREPDSLPCARPRYATTADGCSQARADGL